MSQKLRIAIPLGIVAVAGVAFAANVSVGNLSSFGWESIALICPVGALGTMLASKMMVPRAVISLVLAAAAIVLLGRAFCGWVCPVPVVSKLRGLFKRKDAAAVEAETGKQLDTAPLTADERAALKASCGSGHMCASCDHHKPADSRHFILGGTLLSAAIFGFPVFCLVCPVGLTFAFVFLLVLLFGHGDVTWSVVLIPALLLAEVVFFRKWCSHLCPISSFMSLIGKANRTFQPAINDEQCLETAHGTACGRCAAACEVAINPRHPELGTAATECTRCRACADACPTSAIHFPLLARKQAGTEVLLDDADRGASRGAAPVAGAAAVSATTPDLDDLEPETIS